MVQCPQGESRGACRQTELATKQVGEGVVLVFTRPHLLDVLSRKGGRVLPSELPCSHYILEIMPGENLSCFREILNQTELPVRHLVPVSVKSDWFLHFSLLICPKALLSNKR